MTPPKGPGEITIDDDVLARGTHWQSLTDDDSRWLSGTAFAVLTDRPDLAATALNQLSDQLMAVAENGRILEDEEDDVEPGDELYTPNYIHEAQPIAGGILLRLDTKGALYPDMARTMLRLMKEELARHPLNARFVNPDAYL